MPTCGSPSCTDESCVLDYGVCHCGCGQLAPVSERTHNQFNWQKGKPKKFIFGHGQAAEKSPNWKGGRHVFKGYVLIHVGRDHPMANTNGCCYEHRLVVAEREGRMLERHEHIHHRNGIKDDNRSENLELIDPLTHTRLKSKLTPADIPQIREQIADGFSDDSIAVQFGVSGAAIWMIRKGRTWQAVKG